MLNTTTKKILAQLIMMFLALAGLSGLVDSLYPEDRNWWRKSLIVKTFAYLISFLGGVSLLVGMVDIISLNNPILGLKTLSIGALSLFLGLSLAGYLAPLRAMLTARAFSYLSSLTEWCLLWSIDNNEVQQHRFLQSLYQDSYYPKRLVDKGRNTLLRLCLDIESIKDLKSERGLTSVDKKSRKALNRFNSLTNRFSSNRTGLEAIALKTIVADFEFVFEQYKLNPALAHEIRKIENG